MRWNQRIIRLQPTIVHIHTQLQKKNWTGCDSNINELQQLLRANVIPTTNKIVAKKTNNNSYCRLLNMSSNNNRNSVENSHSLRKSVQFTSWRWPHVLLMMTTVQKPYSWLERKSHFHQKLLNNPCHVYSIHPWHGFCAAFRHTHTNLYAREKSRFHNHRNFSNEHIWNMGFPCVV